MEEHLASQFYSGLVAELYEPLVGLRARAEDYVPFLDRSGQPALEIACGTGLPMLELLQRGYRVDGLDASVDMLEICREKARKLGLDVRLHHQEMQRMRLPERYRSIFLANASFTLLTSDDDARATLERIHEHLLPGGSVLIPLEVPDAMRVQATVGRSRELLRDDQTLVRFVVADAVVDVAERTVRTVLRYEKHPPSGPVVRAERVFRTRWWEQDVFRGMLLDAGFSRASCRSPRGGRASVGDSAFVFVAQRGE